MNEDLWAASEGNLWKSSAAPELWSRRQVEEAVSTWCMAGGGPPAIVLNPDGSRNYETCEWLAAWYASRAHRIVGYDFWPQIHAMLPEAVAEFNGREPAARSLLRGEALKRFADQRRRTRKGGT